MRAKTPCTINGVQHWRCARCERWLPSAGYYSAKRAPNGLKAQCKECHLEGALRTRNRDTSRDNNREHMRRARVADPEKFRARDREASRGRPHDEKSEARGLLNRAVRSGLIMRPKHCSECGRARKVEGHHPDYAKPLSVIWLCYECHGRCHRAA